MRTFLVNSARDPFPHWTRQIFPSRLSVKQVLWCFSISLMILKTVSLQNVLPVINGTNRKDALKGHCNQWQLLNFGEAAELECLEGWNQRILGMKYFRPHRNPTTSVISVIVSGVSIISRDFSGNGILRVIDVIDISYCRCFSLSL